MHSGVTSLDLYNDLHWFYSLLTTVLRSSIQYVLRVQIHAECVLIITSLVWLKPLKKALRMMGAPNLISDNMDCGLSYSVISYLKKLSQQVSRFYVQSFLLVVINKSNARTRDEY